MDRLRSNDGLVRLVERRQRIGTLDVVVVEISRGQDADVGFLGARFVGFGGPARAQRATVGK